MSRADDTVDLSIDPMAFKAFYAFKNKNYGFFDEFVVLRRGGVRLLRKQHVVVLADTRKAIFFAMKTVERARRLSELIKRIAEFFGGVDVWSFDEFIVGVRHEVYYITYKYWFIREWILKSENPALQSEGRKGGEEL